MGKINLTKEEIKELKAKGILYKGFPKKKTIWESFNIFQMTSNPHIYVTKSHAKRLKLNTNNPKGLYTEIDGIRVPVDIVEIKRK